MYKDFYKASCANITKTNGTLYDYVHFNSIDFDRDSNFAASLRDLDSIIQI